MSCFCVKLLMRKKGSATPVKKIRTIKYKEKIYASCDSPV